MNTMPKKGGKRTHTVVPPISTTNADCFEMSESSDARNAAPRIEFVGPEELTKESLFYSWGTKMGRVYNVLIGRREASEQLRSIPSLLVMNTGQFRRILRAAC